MEICCGAGAVQSAKLPFDFDKVDVMPESRRGPRHDINLCVS
jgi:hypothetical protein